MFHYSKVNILGRKSFIICKKKITVYTEIFTLNVAWHFVLLAKQLFSSKFPFRKLSFIHRVYSNKLDNSQEQFSQNIFELRCWFCMFSLQFIKERSREKEIHKYQGKNLGHFFYKNILATRTVAKNEKNSAKNNVCTSGCTITFGLKSTLFDIFIFH